MVDTTNRTSLIPEDIRTIREADPTLITTGAPECWYLSSSTVIGCWPTTVTALSVRYIKIPADLSTGADVPTVPTRFQYLIVDGACSYAYRDKDNAEMAGQCDDSFERGILQMTDSLLSVNYDSPATVVVSGSTDW